MASIEELLTRARPVTRTVRLCLRGDLVAARERAERELEQARAEDALHNREPLAPAIAQRIVDLEAEQEADTIEVEVRALGRGPWQRLLTEHHPTDDDTAQGLDYGAGFPDAALRACCWFPADGGLMQLDEDQAAALFEALTNRQFLELFGAVLTVNMGATDLPKSVAATAVLRSSGPRSTTAPPEASPGDAS